MNTLDYWRKRVRRHRTPAAAGFVELAPTTDGGGLEIELDLGGGAVLRIRRGG